MAKILLWNVPTEYTDALLKEARRLAPELQVTAVDPERDPIIEAYRLIVDAYDKGQPFTMIVVFVSDPEYRPEERENYELVFTLLYSLTHADYMHYQEEIPPLPDFIAEFNRTFHPWKKSERR